jgi:hypothetical protein
MITKKTWVKYTRERTGNEDFRLRKTGTAFRDDYTGWFLFGFIPLYKTRERSFQYSRDGR